MLTKLTNDMISKYWHYIETAIVASVPGMDTAGEEATNRLLQGLLMDELQAWILYQGEEDGIVLYAMVITHITMDKATGALTLLVYALYGYKAVVEELWQDGFKTLQKYARDNDCFQIAGFTSVDKVKKIVRDLGGNTDVTYVTLEV